MKRVTPILFVFLLSLLATVSAEERVVFVRDFSAGPGGGVTGEWLGPVLYRGDMCLSVLSEKFPLQCFDGVDFTEFTSPVDADVPLIDVGAKAVFRDRLVFLGRARVQDYPFAVNAFWSFDGAEIVYHGEAANVELSELQVFQDAVYFDGGPRTADISIRNALWRFNGESIELADDFDPGRGGYPEELTVVGDLMFFRGNSSSLGGGELWQFDGVESTMVGHWSTDDAYPSLLTAFDDRLYFRAFDSVTGVELWVSDGQSTEIVVDLAPGRSNGFPGAIFVYNDKLYVNASGGDPSGGVYTLSPDGLELNRILDGVFIDKTVVFRDQLFFGGNVQGEWGLWRFDGQGISRVPTPEGLKNFTGFQVYRDELYFAAVDESHGSELWKLTYFSACDLNADSACDAQDIDLLTRQATNHSLNLAFDVNLDEYVGDSDREFWVHELKGTWFGDANLDGEFDSGDFAHVFALGKYETQDQAGWSEGDWDGNGSFTTDDFVLAFQDGGYEQGPRTTAAVVPEPGACLLLVLGLLPWLCRRPARNRV